MASMRDQAEVRVGRQGRLVIPAHLRKALGIGPGDTVLARLEDGRLILEKRQAILARVRERFRRVPVGVSLVDELLRDRREEARRETAG